jgi:MSHA pilin protein MshD
MNRRRQSGATLIELLVSVVIISVVATSAMMLVAQTAGRSGDPLLRTQAIAIAEAYMEEILLQPLIDPSGGNLNGHDMSETRPTFDDVTDYHNLSDTGGAVDQYGNTIPGLESYEVEVDVSDSSINGEPAKRIQVSVRHKGRPDVVYPLVAYRTL